MRCVVTIGFYLSDRHAILGKNERGGSQIPPTKLSSNVLIALGILSTGCGDKDTVTATPCLGVPYDTGDTGDTSVDRSHRMASTDDTPAVAVSPTRLATTSRTEATHRVLNQGTLPEDVAEQIHRRLRRD